MQKITSIEQSLLEQALQSVTKTENGGVKGTFIFPLDCPAFDGHFPGQPVLPAVVQIAAVRLLAAKHLDLPLVPVKMDRAKFKTMVGPEEPMTVTISLDQADKNVTLSFSIAKEGKKVATGEIICRA